MVRRTVLFGAVLVGSAALAAGVLPAAHANDVAQFTTVFATDVAHAGYGGMRGGDGTGTIALSGVSGSVTEAYLYWQGPTNTDDTSANATVSFAGTSVTGSHIGTSDSNCWDFENSQAYRADVTALVSGNGDYALADMIKPGTADISGASLVVFYDDGDAANNRDVVLFDGNDSNESNPFDADGWNVTLDGINYTSGSASLDLHVGDGQTFTEAAVVANGTELAAAGAIFQGDTVPNGPTAGTTGGGLWDIRSFDATSLLAPGPNTIEMTSDYVDDCLSLVVAAVNLPAGAAPNQPTTTTTTTAPPPPDPQPTVAPVAAVARPVAARPAFTG
jgi:hypothetical protein